MERIDDSAGRLLVLGAGPPQLGLIEAARERGVWTAVCDRDPAAPGFRLADRRCIVSIEDEPTIERLASALELDGIIAPGRDRSTAAAARIARKLGIPHPLSPTVAELLANRPRQREVLAAAGIRQPRWQAVSAETRQLPFPFPVVVKTVDRDGHTALVVVEHPAELPAALEAASEVIRSGPIVVEEYLDGVEVTVTGYSIGGQFHCLAVTDRSCSAPPLIGVPLSESWPSSQEQVASAVARDAVEAVGILEGPSHVRLRLEEGGPSVLQVSARLGANHEAALVECVTGIDLDGLALDAALGKPVSPDRLARNSPARVGGAIIAFLVAPEGVLEAVELPDGLEGVRRSWVYREAGERFGPLRRPSDRAGAVLVSGGSREEAERAASGALERIRFITADAGSLV